MPNQVIVPVSDDFLVLPEKQEKAPTCFHENLWFRHPETKTPEELMGDGEWEEALVAMCIGERECPTSAACAEFAIAGAVMAALTGGKYIIPPRNVSEYDLQFILWEKLWVIVEETKDKEILDREFLAFVLREHLPLRHDPSGPDSPYYKSHFRMHWSEYPDTQWDKIGNLRLRHLKEGREIFASLPEPIANSIGKVASYAPRMLETFSNYYRHSD